MYFPDETERERKTLLETLESVIHGRDIVRDLLDIIERYAGDVLILEEKQVRERGLRTFDLGGEQSLLAHVQIE
jgi:hypothetical protein